MPPPLTPAASFAAPRQPPAPAEKAESELWRGFRWGVGFMLAVVTLLLLIVLVLLWLAGQPGWKGWVEQLSP